MHKSRNKIQKYWVADVALRQNNNTSIQPTGTKMATESTVVARNLAYCVDLQALLVVWNLLVHFLYSSFAWCL